MTTEAENTGQQTFNPLAAVYAWLIPGLGHWIGGERTRGALIFLGIAFLWICGLFLGGVDAVDRTSDRLWFVAQAGSGPIAFAVNGLNERVIKTGAVGELIDAPATRGQTPQKISTSMGIARANEYGILFTALAGLMNMIAILDAATRNRSERRREGNGT